MEKSIELILQLSQNPKYEMTDSEYKRLQEYFKNKNSDNVKNTNHVLKNNIKINKNNI